MPAQPYEAKVSLYPDDLLPQLQRTLAILADLEARYEIERDFLESWSGPREVKDYLVADLEQCHRANREQLAWHLERLRQGRILEPTPPTRTDH